MAVNDTTNTMAQTALMRADDRTEALRDSVSEMLSMDEPRKRFAGMMCGLDIHYSLGEGHPLLGRRMPDLDLATADDIMRVAKQYFTESNRTVAELEHAEGGAK